MVAVFNKELLSWYLITLKLNQTVETGIHNAQSPTVSGSVEFPQEINGQIRQESRGSNSIEVPIKEDESGRVEINYPESDWVISIKEKLDQPQNDDAASSWAKLCIYRIPHCLRDGDDKAYIPQIVSLGPYHHDKKRLRNMDQHKWQAAHRILKRTNQDITVYLDAVKELEEKTRACYEGTICLSSNEFVEMMVLDSCFILELLSGATGVLHNWGTQETTPFLRCVVLCIRVGPNRLLEYGSNGGRTQTGWWIKDGSNSNGGTPERLFGPLLTFLFVFPDYESPIQTPQVKIRPPSYHPGFQQHHIYFYCSCELFLSNF